jgi:glycerol kinase
MAYSTGDVLDAMRAGTPIDRLRVDGGAAENDWLMQFQADVLDLRVERPDHVETTAAGAACLAGLAAGVWPTADAFLAGRRFTSFIPGAGRSAARAGAAGWARAVQATLYWAHIFKDA